MDNNYQKILQNQSFLAAVQHNNYEKMLALYYSNKNYHHHNVFIEKNDHVVIQNTNQKLFYANGQNDQVNPEVESSRYFVIKKRVCRDDDVCAICYCEFDDEIPIVMIKECCHKYHKQCIDEWFEKANRCPECNE